MRMLRAAIGACISLLAASTVWAQAGRETPSVPRLLQIERLKELPPPEREAAFAEYVTLVRQRLDAGESAAALALADKACGLWKNSRRPLLHRAAAQLGLQQFGACIESARAAAKARADRMEPAPRPDEEETSYWEGEAFYRTQRYDEALGPLQRATERSPQWAEAARAYAEACFVAGRTEAAAAAYGRAFALDPESGSGRDVSYYAESLVAGGDLERGIAVMQQALGRSPYEPGMHANMASLLEREGDWTEAYYHFTLELLLHGVRGPFAQQAIAAGGALLDSVRADPAHPGRHELLLISSGLGFLDEKRAHQALHDLEHAASITRTATVLPQLLLGEALLRTGKLDAARRQLDLVLQLEPDFVPALVLLAETWRALGERELAQLTVEKAYRLFPKYWKLLAPQG